MTVKRYIGNMGSNYGVMHRAIAGPAEPSKPRSFAKVKGPGVYWTFKCGRRHRIPNITKSDFSCPNCEDKFNGS